jgi:endogenous inhibitor of DNA gyrase (YacG/DUF329 family)
MAPYDHDQPSGSERRGPRCPICKQPVVDAHKPFCSKRCADVDLHRWLAGVYRVPTNEQPEDEGEKER